MILVHPTYFSPIIQYAKIVQSDTILFEISDNFKKQTYRNRCEINTANGVISLNIPIQHTKGIKQPTKDVKIDYKDGWNKLHLKTLKTAYNSSPFFEFYIDELLPIFNKKYTFLLDLNIECHKFVMEALQIEIPFTFTSEYQKETSKNDYRFLAEVQKNKFYNLTAYYQLFNNKDDFKENLSILDLIFMEGPNALNNIENKKYFNL